jgi:dienelactone hydrolase
MQWTLFTKIKSLAVLLVVVGEAIGLATVQAQQPDQRREAKAPGDNPLFYFMGDHGSYPVGFKVVEQFDFARTYRRKTDDLGKPYQGERARPLQTLIWYPAERSSGVPMTFGDYVDLWATETSFGHSKMPFRAKEWASIMQPTLSTRLWAMRDASQAPIDSSGGRFPLLIYAPGGSGMAWENADLCEYIASYGYVVIASPSMGPMTRDVSGMGDLSGANEQARDISFLIGYAQTLRNVNPAEIAVAGMSWGGMSNLFAAARDNRIEALVALDGSMRYYPGIVRQAGDVHADEMMIPLLSFQQSEVSLENEDQARRSGADMVAQKDGPNVLNDWVHGDLITVRMLGLQHAEFAAQWQRNEDMWKYYTEFLPADYGRKDGMIGYSWVARYTLAFLDAYLKRDVVAKTFLKRTPAENGVPKHLMAVSYRASSGVAFSFDGFRSEIGRQGFEHAQEIYADFQKKKPGFKLDEGVMLDWSDELINDDHIAEAITLLKLNLQIHPASAPSYEALGDAFVMSKQESLAITAYKNALEKSPTYAPPKRKLEELEHRKRQ